MSLLLYPETRNVLVSHKQISAISIFVVFWERRAFKANYYDLVNFTCFIISFSPSVLLLGIVQGPSGTVSDRIFNDIFLYSD